MKQLLELIINRLRHWYLRHGHLRHGQRASGKRHGVTHRREKPILKKTSADVSQAQSQPPRLTTSQSSEHITYTRSRGEAVTALNRILKHGKTDQPKKSTPLPHQTTNAAGLTPEAEQLSCIKSLADAAYLCECQGRLSEAEQLYQQAITLSIQRFGEGHLAIAPHLSDLATFYCNQQRHTQAQPLLEQTLKIQHQHQTIHHPDKGETLHQLANIYRHLEDYGKAEALYQQAFYTFRQAFGLEHARTQAVYHDLIQMIAIVIASGQFETLVTELPHLDLDTLGDTYSWAKPDWIKKVEPSSSAQWVDLNLPLLDLPLLDTPLDDPPTQ